MLLQDGIVIEGVKVIFQMQFVWEFDKYFGLCLVFDCDGMLFVIIGECLVMDVCLLVQDVNMYLGKVLCIDLEIGCGLLINFFVNGGGQFEIWLWGYCNL